MKTFNEIEISDIIGLSETKKRDEFHNLVQSIDLQKDEDYDCSTTNVWSYHKGFDIREGINIKFGNMLNGFPFHINGVSFVHSEGAYIAGAYASNNDDCIRIQSELTTNSNGLKCKRIYRNLPEYTMHIRKDWYEYNVQWMLYILWQKCISNEDFSSLVRSVPIDAHLVENTSLHHGATAEFWGAKNKQLTSARKVAMEEIERTNKKGKTLAKILAKNSINDIGHFTGKNVMGKIIKLCSLGLYYNQEPPIDLELLSGKKLYLLGQLLDFSRKS